MVGLVDPVEAGGPGAPGSRTIGSVWSAATVCSPCSRAAGSSVARPGHGAPSTRPRPVSWSASVAHRTARPRQPTSSHGVGTRHVLPDPDRDPVPGHVDRSEVEVLADVVLIGPDRGQRGEGDVLGVHQVELDGLGSVVGNADVPEPRGPLRRTTAAPPTPSGRPSGRIGRPGTGRSATGWVRVSCPISEIIRPSYGAAMTQPEPAQAVGQGARRVEQDRAIGHLESLQGAALSDENGYLTRIGQSPAIGPDHSVRAGSDHRRPSQHSRGGLG